MLEIIALIALCNANKKNALIAGKRAGSAVGLTIGLWFGMEIVGAIIGFAAGLGMGSYILALVFAIIGGVISYAVSKSPSKKVLTPGGEYANMQGVYVPNNANAHMTGGAFPIYPGQAPAQNTPMITNAFPQTNKQAQNSRQNLFCANCGCEMESYMKFCKRCGAAAGTANLPVSTPVVPPVPAPCVHEYEHYVCIKCGEKAPKPQLVPEGKRKQNQYTYEDYTARTAEEAKHFLSLTVVTEPCYYVMVHTPEGEWGCDKEGIFLSQLCGFQHELSLRQCDAQTALLPVRMCDLQAAANKITDNYTLSITCGECGFNWIDGVGYRTKTIVRCPECGKYNLADTENIRFNAI